MFQSIERAMEAGKSYDEAVLDAARPMHDNIRCLLEHQPFYPFRMNLTSRSVHEVRNPDMVRLRDCVVALCEPDETKPGALREQCIIALIHVVSLTVTLPDEPAVVESPEVR
jgi:hypothetical protein